MKKLLLPLCGWLLVLLSCGPAWGAALGADRFTAWAKATRVAGYSFGGVDEPDPGVLMAIWSKGQDEMVGLQLRPLAEFKVQAQQVINKKKPVAFTYKGMAAVYTDALAPSGSVALSWDKAGRMLVLMNMGQPRAFTQAELVKILDGMSLDKLLD